jgi:nicotinic acid mononucleotide adenylyltransferase
MLNEEISLLINIIEESLKISFKDIKSSSRKREIVDARRIFTFICTKFIKLKQKDIGDILNNRKHSSISNSLKKHKSLYETNKNYINKTDLVSYLFLKSDIIFNKFQKEISDLKIDRNSVIDKFNKSLKKFDYIKNYTKSSKICLYFGEFNPINNSHLVLANFILHKYNFDEIWFVVSDFKKLKKCNLENIKLSFNQRNELIKSCTLDNPYFEVSHLNFDTEESNSLKDFIFQNKILYNNCGFTSVFKMSNLIDLKKQDKYINEENKIMIIPDCDFCKCNIEFDNYKNIELINDIPNINITSDEIKRTIQEKDGISKLKYIIPNECLYLIEKNNYYKNDKEI